MTTLNSWVNEDGIEVNFGPVISGPMETLTQHTKGNTKELQMDIDLSVRTLAVTEAASAKDEFLPKGAYIVAARLIQETAFDVASEIGTKKANGDALDKDGLIKTSTTVGAVGALVGTVLSADSYIAISATGATAAAVGKGKLIVEYII